VWIRRGASPIPHLATDNWISSTRAPDIHISDDGKSDARREDPTCYTPNFVEFREATERQGNQVEGLAPTSGAAQQLEEGGIHSGTLQGHLARSHRDDGDRHLYIVDESSLASTRQVNEFLRKLKEQDRVIFVGDTRQHHGVEARRPFQQLQEAGMHRAHLDKIIRQKDPALKQAVEQLARGEVWEAIEPRCQAGPQEWTVRGDSIHRTFHQGHEATIA